MKNKQRALVLAVLFITAIFIVNSYADPGTAKAKTIVGFAGVPTTEFSKAKELGAATVQVFSETEIARDPDFLGYYIIDEPCYAAKWNIALAEFRQFYDTVKEVDPDIKIMVNFGYLGCLEDFIIEGEEGKIVDIATFVITPKKLKLSPDYIANEAATAKRVLGPGDYDFSILHDGLTRLYRVHVLRGYDINNPSPVIIAFHGGGGNAEACVDYFQLNENITNCPADRKEFKNVYLAVIIATPSDNQIDFINSHYDFVMTSVLDTQLREAIKGPKLALYHSIQGAWEHHGFDWNDIYPNENMFCHNSSELNPYDNNRILTRRIS